MLFLFSTQKKFEMQKFAFSTCVFLFFSTASAQKDFHFKNVNDSDWNFTSESNVRIARYYHKKPPVLVLKSSLNLNDCIFDGRPCSRTRELEIKLPEGKSTSHTILLKYKDDKQISKLLSFEIASENKLGFKIIGQSALNKNLLMSPDKRLLMLSPKGDLLFYLESNFSLIDFRQHIVNNTIFYSYFQVSKHHDGVNSDGHRIILNEHFELLKKIETLMDFHEFIFLGLDHYIFSLYSSIETVSGHCEIIQKVVELKNGKVLNEFSTEKYKKIGYIFDRYKKHAYKGRYCIKGTHLNSVVRLSHDKWIISFGNESIFLWNLKKNKAEWIFHGYQDQFGISNHFQTTLHHTPHFDFETGRVILFANNLGNKNVRILDFILDFENKQVISEKSIEFPEQFSTFGGSVFIDKNTLSIGFGSKDSGPWDFIEHTSGSQVFFIKILDDKYKILNYRIYRSVP